MPLQPLRVLLDAKKDAERLRKHYDAEHRNELIGSGEIFAAALDFNAD